MSEIEQLRAEVGELRGAVIELAHAVSTFRQGLWMLPDPRKLDSQKATLTAVHSSLYALRSLPESTGNVQGAAWLLPLEKRAGESFEDHRAKLWKRIEAENDTRRNNRAARSAG